MEKFREYLFIFYIFVTLVIVGIGFVYTKVNGYDSTNSHNYKNKHTKSVPYTSPISTQQEKLRELQVQSQMEYYRQRRPVVIVRQSEKPTPDDANEEGYEEGYEQGMYDGLNGYSRGMGYDDSSDYYNYYETRYQEGYEEGYEDGYRRGREEYETRIEEEEDDWSW